MVRLHSRYLSVRRDSYRTRRWGGIDSAALLIISPDEDTISGEIAFARPTFAKPLTASFDATDQRLLARSLHDMYVARVLRQDPKDVAALYSSHVRMALRDYAGGGQPARESRTHVIDHYRQLFGRYRIESVEIVERLVESWFTLAELRWLARSGDGACVTFCTIELSAMNERDEIVFHFGWGTDPRTVD